MANILILTKNLLAEQDLQYLLQRSNEEVYCSSSLLQNLENNLGIIQNFSVVIFSDTVPFLDFSKYITFLKRYGFAILRKGSKEPLKSTIQSNLNEEIDDWISEDSSPSEIIEKIAKIKAENLRCLKTSNQNLIIEGEDFSANNYMRFVSKLSKNEQAVLTVLYMAKGKLVSREQLCNEVWNKTSSNSNLSQLSTIIARLKNRIVKIGFEEEELNTIWRKGYRLGDHILSFLEMNNFKEKWS